MGKEKVPAPPKKRIGKASTYSPEIAKRMCEQLSEGIPLREICRQEGYPAWRTVYDWMYKDEALTAAIAHSRDIGYDSLAEECLAIADDASNDWMERKSEDGESTVGWELNRDHVQRSKLRIETRLKLLAKFNPKKYGDKIVHAGDDVNPVVVKNNIDVFGELLNSLKLKRQEEAK